MTILGFLFAVVSSVLLFVLPRCWASLPFLLGAAYMTHAQEIAIGPLHFPVIRILVAVGFARVMSKGERITGGLKALDWMMIAWAVWTVLCSVFHTDGALVLRLGMVYNALGIYFLFRVFIREDRDVLNVFKLVSILFVPLGIAMVLEKLTGRNAFALLGGVPAQAAIRHGHFRAQGPFGHPILAGTVGAVCLPMALFLWRTNRKLALTGIAATGGIVFGSGSSGPIMTIISIVGALLLWKRRRYLPVIRWMALVLVIALNFIMKDPVYYLLARIDITGGSTGWHRAALIEAAIKHFGDWWLGGTDYTRDWMPTGVTWSGNHTDITNHYIQMGVTGGMPLMLLFIGVLIVGFSTVGKALRASRKTPVEHRFLLWTLGSILFGHLTTFFSVTYFDQSVVFLYFLLASISSLGPVKPIPALVPARNTARTSPDYAPHLSHHR